MSTRHKSTLYNGKSRMVHQRNRFARRLDESMIEEFLSRPPKRGPRMIPVVHHATSLTSEQHAGERALIARETGTERTAQRDKAAATPPAARNGTPVSAPAASPVIKPVRPRRAPAPVKVYPRCIGFYRPRKKRQPFSFREMLAGLIVGGAAAVMGFALLRALILT
jgi:hypothetical protein